MIQLREVSDRNVQDFVMNTFNPPDRNDINTRFLKFLQISIKPVCRHFANGHCRAGSGCRFRHASEISAAPAAEPSRNLARDDTSLVCKFWANGHCKNGSACKFRHDSDSTGHAADGYAGRDKLSHFAKKWGLDEDAMKHLQELPVEVQEDVMASFAPLGGTSSSHMNAKFMAFLRSRSRSEQEGSAWKRPRTW